MEGDNLLTYEEAILLYTHLKLDMAEKFRMGIKYEDFVDFEKHMDLIDNSLIKEEESLIDNIVKGSHIKLQNPEQEN